MKYKVNITGIGSYVTEMASESDLLIIYNDTIKDQDLKDISVTHTVSELKEDVQAGDKITIGTSQHTITAIGSVAIKTLRELGHCTLKFSDSTEVGLPGEIHITGDVPDIKTGDNICITTP